MGLMSRPRPIIILGPTAGGKSALAVELAEAMVDIDGRAGQIISADSMQVYRHMDAGTAKPSAALRHRAVHHMIDCVEPTERFAVSDWLEQAEAIIERLLANHTRPIIVGGTNLYIKALLEGMFDGPPANEAFRRSIAEVNVHELHQQLSTVDPAAAERISCNDRKRITRALEVFEATGTPISDWQKQWESEGVTKRQSDEGEETISDDDRAASAGRYRFNPILIALRWPVEQINSRINLRVKAMFFPEKVDQSLAAETCPNGESLPVETARLESQHLLGMQAREALGYKQVLAAMHGELTMDEDFERTKIQTRRFAKQQRTWLKRFHGVHWLDAGEHEPAALQEGAINLIRSQGEHRPHCEA